MAKGKTSKPATTTKNRDAGTGQYVTKQYADKHPKTTVKETDKKYPFGQPHHCCEVTSG